MSGPRVRARTGWALLVAAIAAVWVAPYAWMVSTSLKTLPEILANPTAVLPQRPQLAAYIEVWRTLPLARYALNSVGVALGIACIQALCALPAAYALAKLRFRGRGLTLALVVACLFVPAQVTYVPVYLMLGTVGLVDTYAALILPFAVSAFGTFLIRQAVLQIPDALIEAARLDGAGERSILLRIVVPWVKPSIVSFFLFSFVVHFSDYFWPLVMTSREEIRTLPLAIALLREQGTGIRWPVVMAGNVLLTVPMLVLFALIQRHLTRALAARMG